MQIEHEALTSALALLPCLAVVSLQNDLEKWRYSAMDLLMYMRVSFQSLPAIDSGAGFLGVGAVYIANLQLRAVQKVTEITKEEKSPELISQHTEDGTTAFPLSLQVT